MADLTDKELEVLAYTLLGEARTEGRAGMSAVMNTIMNRANSGRYPSNPAAVAVQSNSKGIHQYSTWNTKANGGNSPRERFSKDSAAFKEAMEIVQAAIAGDLPDTTGGATHYYSKGIEQPYWFESEATGGATTIGNHVFASREPTSAENAIAGLVSNSAPLPAPAPLTPQTALTTRTVQTVPIDPYTGQPTTALQQAAEREAERLRKLRQQSDPRNSSDSSGYEATLPQNSSAPGKTSRSGATPSGAGNQIRTAAQIAESKVDPVGAGPGSFAQLQGLLGDPIYSQGSGVAQTPLTKAVEANSGVKVTKFVTPSGTIAIGKANDRLMPQGQLYFDEKAQANTGSSVAYRNNPGSLLGNNAGYGPSYEELASLVNPQRGLSAPPGVAPLATPAPLVPPPAVPPGTVPPPVAVPQKVQPRVRAAPRYVPPPPPQTFKGTATGNEYVVGQTYVNSRGQLLVAQADGSFLNATTGKVSVGSSQGKPKGRTASGTPLTSIAASQRWAADFM